MKLEGKSLEFFKFSVFIYEFSKQPTSAAKMKFVLFAFPSSPPRHSLFVSPSAASAATIRRFQPVLPHVRIICAFLPICLFSSLVFVCEAAEIICGEFSGVEIFRKSPKQGGEALQMKLYR